MAPVQVAPNHNFRLKQLLSLLYQFFLGHIGYIQDILQYPVFYCSVSVLNLHFEIIWRAKEIELSNDVTAARVLVKNESLQR